jgi:predicted AlkP superfamily phosphohydrolase/phosphomutase
MLPAAPTRPVARPRARARAPLAALLLTLLAGAPAQAEPARRMVVLGVDGMDPVMLRQYMAEGAVPNLAKLAAQGGFAPLGTSLPPQSPVAWSNFITGMDPGGHGLFDFLAIDRATLEPYLSASRVTSTGLAPIALGRWRLPLGTERTVLLRDGRAFWEYLDDAGVPARLFQVPANYPPVAAGESVSGMGTPDLRGTPGTFQFYTNDTAVAAGARPGGVVRRLLGGRGAFSGTLEGPPNSLLEGAPWATVQFQVRVDAREPVALVDFGTARALLNAGEWSGWLPVRFPLVPGLVEVPGMVRVYLQRTSPQLALYVSPVNIDPSDPAQPISHPEEYARELAEHAGPFYTEEMPEETKALSASLFTPREFLRQADVVMDERRRLLRHELASFRAAAGDRFLFFYLSTIDQQHHMLGRETDPAHPLHDPATPPDLLTAMRERYREVDALVGEAMAALRDGETLVVMSDHGFAPFRRQAHLNAWLEQQGYLRLVDPAQRDANDWLGGIDWKATRAFGIGLNSLYVNTQGRERDGIVPPGERERLAREIAAKLLQWRDPANGEPVVTEAAVREDVYTGAHVAEAPDVVVGYARGYRASWATSTGKVAGVLLEDNDEAWSGDHCMDSRSVPGVLLASRPLAAGQGDLRDLPVTILRYFGVAVPEQMTGRDLLR